MSRTLPPSAVSVNEPVKLSAQPSVYQRGKWWYAKVKYSGGHRDHAAGGWKNHPTRQQNRGRALVVAEEMQERVDRGQSAVADKSQGPTASRLMTVRELSERYLREHHRPRIKDMERWREHALSDLRAYIWPSLGERVAVQIRSADVRTWLAELRKTRAPKTCNLAMDRLSALYGWAIDLAELIEMKNPCRGVERFPTQPDEHHLTLEQVHRFLAMDPAPLPELLRLTWYMAVTGLYTGMRHGELRGLLWEWIDFEGLSIHVKEQWDGLPTKNGYPRLLPLHPELAPHLRVWRRLCDSDVAPVFSKLDGTRMADHTTDDCDRLRKLCGLCGIPDDALGPHPYHVLRHTFSTELHKATGGNADVVGRILGHRKSLTPSVTMGYIHGDDLPYLTRQMECLSYLPPAPEGVTHIETKRARRARPG